MVSIEFPEIPGRVPSEFIRVAKLSLLEEQEEIRLRHGNEDHHIKKHSFWHKHARDHNHGLERNDGPGHISEQEPKHASINGRGSHGHGLPIHGPENGPQIGPPPPYIEDPNAPRDKGYFVLIIIGLFGLVHIIPMVFFFTANEFWMYKFRNTSSNSTDADDRTYLQANFGSLTRLTVTAPGVICNFIAAVGGHKIRAQTRVFCVLAIHSGVLIALAIFANIDTDEWQTLFFIATMGLQLIMACAMSLGGSGSMGLISKLPPRYMKAQLLGEGVSGLFSAILRLISIFCTPTTVGAALMYFITGSILMVGTSIIFYFATQTEFFKYHTRSCKEERKEKIRNYKDFKDCLKITWPIIILNALPMILPVASITNLVVSEYDGSDSVWAKKYFFTICVCIVPAVSGLVGRGIFSYMDYDCSIPTLSVLVISREIIFGTLIFLSNAKPRHHLSVLLKHDWEFTLMMVGNSLTAGFIMTLNMIKSMRMVPKERIELSMMCNMFIMSIMSAATSPLGVLAVDLL